MGETQSGWRLLSVCDYKWSRQHSDLVIGKVGRWIFGGILDQGGGRRAFLDCKRIPTQRKPGSILPISIRPVFAPLTFYLFLSSALS